MSKPKLEPTVKPAIPCTLRLTGEVINTSPAVSNYLIMEVVPRPGFETGCSFIRMRINRSQLYELLNGISTGGSTADVEVLQS